MPNKKGHANMRQYTILLFVIACLSVSGSITASNLSDSLEVKFRLGYNIGGTAPIGIPATIRSIDGYRLTPSFMAGVDASVKINKRWGLSAGIRIENKAMDADLTTKSYRIEVVKGDSKLLGNYTGNISLEVREWMFTVPVCATFHASRKVTLKAGPYVSVLINSGFSGIAFDGYLREGNPTGPKYLIGNVEGERATFDFDADMRRMQFGLAAGVDWNLGSRIGLSADFNWGLTRVFKSDFKAMDQSLFPLFATIGIFYTIK